MLQTDTLPPQFRLQDTNAQTLELSELLHQQRLLLLFEPDLDYVRTARKHLPEILERDLVLLVIAGPQSPLTDYFPEEGFRVLIEREGEVSRAYQACSGTAYLVGKDGTVKNAWASPPAPQAVLAEIDRMPMRQAEIGGR